jgi:hypothetical protein
VSSARRGSQKHSQSQQEFFFEKKSLTTLILRGAISLDFPQIKAMGRRPAKINPPHCHVTGNQTRKRRLMVAHEGHAMIRFAVPIAMVAAYAASPYLSLYEMGQAVRHGDARTLCADIDWASVRDGLKADIASDITGGSAGNATPAPTQAVADSDDLPPFGSGFVTHMAGNVVDRNVTPAHLTQTLGMMALETPRGAGVDPAIQQAHFTSPTSFTVALRPQGEAPGAASVRLRLDLEPSPWGMRWRITRAWIPEAMLEAPPTHNS